MKELNLEVGQKCWSIQLGACEVCFKDDKSINCTNGNFEKEYYLNGKMFLHDHNPSLFESNPFEPKLIQENKYGWTEPKENKADLINALFNVLQNSSYTDLKRISEEKLKKVLESI